MSLLPFTYQDHPVRVVEVEGEPWFVLADLCKVLDLEQVSRVKARLDDALTRITPIADAMGRGQTVTIVSEAGMYEVVIRSDKPEAAAFRRWITSEVLPSIRKHGHYGVAQIQIPQTLPEALRLAADEAERREIAEAKVAQLAPKAEYVDRFVADDDLRLLRNVAKSLGVSESKLRDALILHDWIYVESSSRWSEKQQEKVTICRYSPMADKRAYFRPVPNHEAPRFKGEVMHTLKITPAGATAIERAARRWGLTPTPTEDSAA